MAPSQWIATLKAIGESDEAIDRLRIHTRTGRPLGSDAFLGKLETLLNRRFPTIKMGRPEKSGDSGAGEKPHCCIKSRLWARGKMPRLLLHNSLWLK